MEQVIVDRATIRLLKAVVKIAPEYATRALLKKELGPYGLSRTVAALSDTAIESIAGVIKRHGPNSREYAILCAALRGLDSTALNSRVWIDLTETLGGAVDFGRLKGPELDVLYNARTIETWAEDHFDLWLKALGAGGAGRLYKRNVKYLAKVTPSGIEILLDTFGGSEKDFVVQSLVDPTEFWLIEHKARGFENPVEVTWDTLSQLYTKPPSGGRAKEGLRQSGIIFENGVPATLRPERLDPQGLDPTEVIKGTTLPVAEALVRKLAGLPPSAPVKVRRVVVLAPGIVADAEKLAEYMAIHTELPKLDPNIDEPLDWTSTVLEAFAAPFVRTLATTIGLANLSTRTDSKTADNVTVCGFVVGGQSARRMLIRAIGPELSEFGVTNPASDPRLRIFSDSDVIGSSDDLSSRSDLRDVAAAAGLVGAFPLSAGTRSSAMVITLLPGNYTVFGDGFAAGGDILCEIYDIDGVSSGKWDTLQNQSTRVSLTPNQDGIIGFTIAGQVGDTQKLLVRASGPALEAFNLTGTLPDPTLSIIRASDSRKMAENDDWSVSVARGAS